MLRLCLIALLVPAAWLRTGRLSRRARVICSGRKVAVVRVSWESVGGYVDQMVGSFQDPVWWQTQTFEGAVLLGAPAATVAVVPVAVSGPVMEAVVPVAISGAVVGAVVPVVASGAVVVVAPAVVAVVPVAVLGELLPAPSATAAATPAASAAIAPTSVSNRFTLSLPPV
jgi:hypothetical protein